MQNVNVFNFLSSMFGATALNGSLGPGTQILGPKYLDPNSRVWNVWVPSAGTHHPGTQMKGPRYWDPSVFRSERSEALYRSPNIRGTLWVPKYEQGRQTSQCHCTGCFLPRLEAMLWNASKLWISFQKALISTLEYEVPSRTPMSKTLNGTPISEGPKLCIINHIHWHHLLILASKPQT